MRSSFSWCRSRSLTDTRHHRSAERIIVANASFIVARSLIRRGITSPTALLLEGALGQVRRADPDPVAHRDPVDREQRVQVLCEASDRGRVLACKGVGEPIGRGSSGIERGRVADGVEVRQDFRGVWGTHIRSSR